MDELRQLVTELARSQMRTEEELRLLSQEMREFKEEMREFKEEMRAYQARAERERREMNRRWGELANKMGTLAEDMVAPNIVKVLRDLAGCSEEEVDFFAVRVRKRDARNPHRVHEFDVVAACGDYVLINETKSTLRAEDVDRFVEVLEEIRAFFPEYQGRKFVGVIATLYMRPEVARYAERRGLIAMGFGEETFQVLNSPGFRPRTF
ncbi:MAG: hypothetical protein GXO55_00115 [Chloroflexi bacterium]|nr:hypothetical protein [Chloroflexota bacterium]